MFQVFYIGVAKVDQDVAHVAMATHVCFKCMFQMFHLFQTPGDVALKAQVENIYISSVSEVRYKFSVVKVDRDVAHVAMATHVCSSVRSKCFICFRCMLEVFYLNVAKVDLDVAYTCMLQAYVFKCFRCFIHCKCFIWVLHMFAMPTHVFSWRFRRMLQIFHLDVAKVDLVLYMLQ
jgi:hypothetical protein